MPAVLERKEVWIMHAVLQTNHLCKYYGTGENQVKAVDGISLAIAQGEFTAIVG